jgi:hypothetical protein
MITDDLLEVFQQPPTQSEPNIGTVDPFTDAELDAIHGYNGKTVCLLDCLDGIEVSGAVVFTDHESEFGRDETIAYIKTHFGWLADWYDALDSLDADLRDGDGHLPNAADRLMTHEMRALLKARDQVRAAALTYLIGTAGPGGDLDGNSAVMLSNGFIYL